MTKGQAIVAPVDPKSQDSQCTLTHPLIGDEAVVVAPVDTMVSLDCRSAVAGEGTPASLDSPSAWLLRSEVRGCLEHW